ncbi:hypothetical protein K474DRAFT_1680348 [Panus rudis PR-1116 ss-1]|nr:hypothetical protein K474DRAFT_1680348 [Panus rudis PR-1116 ss-1]
MEKPTVCWQFPAGGYWVEVYVLFISWCSMLLTGVDAAKAQGAEYMFMCPAGGPLQRGGFVQQLVPTMNKVLTTAVRTGWQHLQAICKEHIRWIFLLDHDDAVKYVTTLDLLVSSTWSFPGIAVVPGTIGNWATSLGHAAAESKCRYDTGTVQEREDGKREGATKALQKTDVMLLSSFGPREIVPGTRKKSLSLSRDMEDDTLCHMILRTALLPTHRQLTTEGAEARYGHTVHHADEPAKR